MDEIMMVYGSVYKILNRVNGKFYIGQTTRKIDVRMKEHIRKASSHGQNMPILRAINKYGADNFSISVIDECKSKEELDEQEKYWIGHLNCHYNIRIGGKGGKLSEETKKRSQNP
jgi:group I intron endonuclease